MGTRLEVVNVFKALGLFSHISSEGVSFCARAKFEYV